MYNIKNLSKRGLALFLTLVMCLGMLNLTAFATDGSKLGEVVDGAFVADQENKKLPTEFTKGAANTVSTPRGKVSVTKTAVPVACEDGNQFEVTLKVVTEDKISESIVTPDAAVTLVIDVSGSMKDGGRLTNAKQSAKEFLNSLKKNTPQNSDGSTPKRYVSLVAFSSSASLKQDWVDIMTTNGYNTVVNAINQLSAGGGTNLEQGLSVANGQVSKSTVGNVAKENKFTVVLTDGQPTYAKSSWSTIGDGTECTKAICDATVTTANTLKGNSNAIYSVYYGNANDTCYTTGWGWNKKTVTVGDFLRSFSNSVYSASDAGQLTSSFESISRTIALLTKAWEITDPMGSDVHFMEVTSNQGTSVDCKDGALTWKLREDTPVTKTVSGQPVYTYTLTYRVSVDSAAEDFDVEAIHPLNGYTSLSYGFYKDGNLVDEDGNAKEDQTQLDTIGFNVPGVIVEVPERPWRIEYYQQQDAKAGDYGNYTLVDTTNSKSDAKVWTKVKLEEQDPNYASKYDKANYSVAFTEHETLTISADPNQNVIKVYYNRDLAEVTVNHYYKVVTIKADGTTETREWPETPDLTIYKPDKNEFLYVGDSFTAEEITTWSGISGFEFDHVNSQPRTINKLAKTNVINLYYVKTIDERAEASVVVDHVYRTHTWTLIDGKYELADTEITLSEVQHESGLKAHDVYTAKNAPEEGYEQYKPDPENDSARTIILEPGENKITLYFDTTVDNRGDELHLTVRHRYTKTVTEVVNGQIVTTVSPDGEVGRTDNITFYAGETVTVNKQRVYNGDTYEIPGGDSVELPHPQDGSEYELNYELVVTPKLTSVTVNHIYQTVIHETQERYEDVTRQEIVGYETEVDDEGNEVRVPIYEDVTEKVLTGIQVVDRTETDDTVTETDDKVYVNQSYTAKPKGRDSYVLQTSEADRTKIVEENGATVIEVYYLRDSKADNRDEATIDVLHRYTTHLTTVVGGEVKTFDVIGSVAEVPEDEFKAGDRFTAERRTTGPDGEEYTVVGEPELTRILHAGTNSTIIIDYKRSGSDLENAAYEVHYEYYTRSMTIEDGVAVWGEPVMDVEMSASKAPVYVNEDVYVGQKVELDTGAVDGYAPYGSNPAATQFLKEEGNVYTFQYVKDVPLPRVAVTVNHHYTTRTLTLDGEFSDTQDMPGRPVYWYVGESCEANALPVAGLVRVTVNGVDTATEAVVALQDLTADVVVDFYYEVENDLRDPASYTVQHIYHTYDWDGSEIESEMVESEPQKTETFIFKTGSASISLPENAGYELTEATFNGESVSVDASGTYSFTVLEAENEIVFVYERHIDTRPLTSAQIIHEYYASQDALENGELEGSDLVNIPDLRVGETIQAELRTSNGGRTYAMANASALSITVVENKEQNVITIQYIRATTTYQVIHEYYTNGELTGSTSSTLAGNAGDTITAESIAKETTYGGNTYTYTRASGDPLTLVQGENGAIILRYDRSTGGGTPTPTPTPDDDDDDDDPPAPPTPEDETTPEEEVPEEEVPLVDTPEEEIPDEEIPMIQEPKTPEEEEEEILDEDVPLSVVPQTGDGSGLWFNMGLVSALGLALLRFFRKREE